jgi:glycosyltransferase involved in cell wall biosynthesis
MNPEASRVAIVFDRFGPYHVARLEAAADTADVVGIEVFGESREYAWDQVASSGRFKRITLFPGASYSESEPAAIRRAIGDALSTVRPHVVALPGWSHPAALGGLAWCRQMGVPSVLMSESTAWDERRSVIKEGLKRQVVQLCDSGLVGGAPHRAYLSSLGMPRERIHLGYDAVDNQHFAVGAQAARTSESGRAIRNDLPSAYFLASARFVPKKNLVRLLEAYAVYVRRASASPGAATKPVWDLVLLGDGELREELVGVVDRVGLAHRVHMPGFKQYTELPAFYGLASAFVHASTTEQWGLVVNEAMAAGLPVLVSRTCGCCADLVIEGENGFSFDPFSVADIAHAMMRVASSPRARLISMGEKSQTIVAQWGPERFADGLRLAASQAIQSHSSRFSMFGRLVLSAMNHRN